MNRKEGLTDTEVQDDLILALDGGDAREIERSIKWYLCLHQILLRNDDGHRGGRRALGAVTRRFLEWADGDYTKLLDDWLRDCARCGTMPRRSRNDEQTRCVETFFNHFGLPLTGSKP